ncbi:cyclase family protein [Desulfobacula sp.]|uniref:cyclase family protein n=1 Tax=Desulfobacula sp. TaxID=2593537 RepID=UPI0034343C18
MEPHEKAIKNIDFLLLHTGWSHYWGTDKYFTNYRVLTIEAAKILQMIWLICPSLLVSTGQRC